MTYSEVVHLLSSHMVPRSHDNPQLIPLLEKFVNDGEDEQIIPTQMDDSDDDDGIDRGEPPRSDFQQDFDRAEFPESQHEDFEREQEQSHTYQSNY